MRSFDSDAQGSEILDREGPRSFAPPIRDFQAVSCVRFWSAVRRPMWRILEWQGTFEERSLGAVCDILHPDQPTPWEDECFQEC